MKRRRQHVVPPPAPGPYARCEIVEAISEEEKAGRPVAPPLEPRPAGRPIEICEAISEEEKTGRPVAPPLPTTSVRPPAEETEHQPEVVAMYAAFATLTGPERLVIEKVFIQRRSFTELASMLSTTPAAVRALTVSAAHRLREILTRSTTLGDLDWYREWNSLYSELGGSE